MIGRWAAIEVLVTAVVLLLILVGCGGSATYTAPPGVQTATYVGTAVCINCHKQVGTLYATSAMGQDFHSVNVNGQNEDMIDGYDGACLPCHTVGFGDPSGFASVSATPQLVNIGCEDCHGPGSRHAAKPSSTNITKVPVAEDTCWNCHAPTYKMMQQPVPPTTDLTLHDMAPSAISFDDTHAPSLLGLMGYNEPPMPGPHSLVENTCVTCHFNPDPNSRNLNVMSVLPKSDHIHDDEGSLPDLGTCAHCHGSQDAAEALYDNLNMEINGKLIVLVGEDTHNPGSPDPNMGGGLLGAYATAHHIDVTTNSAPDDPYVKRYKGARWDITYINATCPTHNPPFVRKLLDDCKSLLGHPGPWPATPAAASARFGRHTRLTR